MIEWDLTIYNWVHVLFIRYFIKYSVDLIRIVRCFRWHAASMTSIFNAFLNGTFTLILCCNFLLSNDFIWFLNVKQNPGHLAVIFVRTIMTCCVVGFWRYAFLEFVLRDNLVCLVLNPSYIWNCRISYVVMIHDQFKLSLLIAMLWISLAVKIQLDTADFMTAYVLNLETTGWILSFK